MVIVELLVYAALALLSGAFLLLGIHCCYHIWKHWLKNPRNRYGFICIFVITPIIIVLAPLLAVSASGYYFVLSCNEVIESRTAAPDPPALGSASQPPEPDFQTSPPITKEEDLSLAFRLSAVENSLMLALGKQLIGSAEIDREQLAAAADGQLDRFIAQYSQSDSFFPFYPNLADYFPSGESVNDSFDSVGSLEECDAQLRSAGGRLERRRAAGLWEQMGEICHQLAIRSRDALNFTKYQTTRSQKDQSIWLYSEISFAALLNEYIYTRPEGITLSDWYYRMAQVYDYLGGIADTEELELRMYFLSAVFLRSSFETLKEQGIQVYPNAYDYEIWTLYMKLLYRVALRVAPAQTEGFYQEIQTVETAVLQQPLPDKVITRTTKALNDLELYQQWRGRYA